MNTIKSYHAHVYYDESSIEQARSLCLLAKETFSLEMGTMHEKAVGPHPMWSCQLAFEPSLFADLIPWLALNRKGLIFFIHPNTGDDLLDHTEHAIWMEKICDLNLDIFTKN